jgi:hypothetical protein
MSILYRNYCVHLIFNLPLSDEKLKKKLLLSAHESLLVASNTIQLLLEHQDSLAYEYHLLTLLSMALYGNELTWWKLGEYQNAKVFKD